MLEKIKALVIKAFIKKILNEFKGYLLQVPLFASGPFNRIALYFAEKLIVLLIEKTSLRLHILKIHIDVSNEVGEINDLAEYYYLNKDTMSHEQIKEHDKKMERAIYDLVEFNIDKLRQSAA